MLGSTEGITQRRGDGGHRPPLQQFVIASQSFGEFTMVVVKVIVSDYRYFLFTIYDMRFTQPIDVVRDACFLRRIHCRES
jgi:hypothetical protein